MASRKEENIISKFFREESEEFLGKQDQGVEETSFKRKTVAIAKGDTVDEKVLKEKWKSIREFFATSKGSGLPEGLAPIHFHPEFLSKNTLLNYPVWISQSPNGTSESDVSCISLVDLIEDQMKTLYPDPDEGKIIKSLTPRIVLEMGDLLQSNGESQFWELFEKASLAISDKLSLRGPEKELFDEQAKELGSRIPIKGVLIPFSSTVSFDLLQAALFSNASQRNRMLKSRIDHTLPRLLEMLAVESENDPEASDPDHLKSAMGFAGTYLDFEKLSTVIPESSSEHLPEERIARIKSVILTIRNAESLLRTNARVLVPENLLQGQKIKPKELFEGSEVIEFAAGEKACSKAIEQYDGTIKDYIELIKSLRIGELELAGKYVPDYHDNYFSFFDDNSFSEEEAGGHPQVVLISDSRDLVSNELYEFSELLHKGIPVKIIGLKDARSIQEGPTDPVSLAISYRNTYVAQLTSLSPQNLFKRFSEGISSFSPSFFHVEIAGSDNDLNAFIELSASVEGRDFPGLVYNGHTGTDWGSRFDITDNPQPENDWPEYEYRILNEEGKETVIKTPLSFPDFAFLNNKYQSEFLHIDPEYWTEELIHLSDYLDLEGKDVQGKVPFIWMADESIHKVAVSWNLVIACKERLDFWYYLQDSGGINNYHVKKAIEKFEEKIRKETKEEIEQLKEQHASEIEEIKKQSADQAMEHLTSALLDLDTEQIISTTADKPIKPELNVEPIGQEAGIEAEIEDASEEPAGEKVEPELVSEEPWIESPLCTNCNECTDINNRMFKYNPNKQAFIADPEAGTFAQLVKAAEKCPVKIIHPGKPLNPEEPGLDELLKRAAKFK